MLLTLPGIFTSDSDSQPLKALAEILCTPSGIVTRVRLEQPENMLSMFVTLDVFQLERSMEDNRVQLSNMDSMVITERVSQSDMSRDDSLEQRLNM